MIGNAGWIDFDFDLTKSLVENSALEADALRDSLEHDRDAHRHLLSGDERLEIDVKYLPLDRVPLDLASQRLRGLSAHRYLDHGALGLNGGEHPVEIARVERERLRIAAVTVDHRRNLSLTAKSTRGALSG